LPGFCSGWEPASEVALSPRPEPGTEARADTEGDERVSSPADHTTHASRTGSPRALDARVELRGQDPRLVAGSWLRTQRLASIGGTSR
jgi:hypothetical protein